jgi:hypothetical protein
LPAVSSCSAGIRIEGVSSSRQSKMMARQELGCEQRNSCVLQ